MSPRKKSTIRERRASIRKAVEAILALDLDEQTTKALLNCCLWQWTEVRGKYKTRFISKAAQGQPKSNLHHEHVHTRKSLIEKLLDPEGESVDRILRKAVACTVTRDEHIQLNRVDESTTGWKRYQKAGIEVFNQKTGQNR